MDAHYMNDRLRELGVYDSFRHRLEYRRLANLLPGDRKLLAASGGLFRGRRWLVFVLSDGWYFISAHPVTGVESLVLPYGEIESARAKKGLLFGSLSFTHTGGEERILNMKKTAPEAFAASIQASREEAAH
jgi:hypothetical protein